MRATEKQINLIQKLIDTKKGEYVIFAEKELKSSTQIEFNTDTQSNEVVYQIDSEYASELIENLLKLEDASFRPISEKQYNLICKFIKKGSKKEVFEKHNVQLNVAFISTLDFQKASALISDLLKK